MGHVDLARASEECLEATGIEAQAVLRNDHDALEKIPYELVDERLFGRETPVERSHADACGASDLFNTGIEALLAKDCRRRVEDTSSVLCCVTSKRMSILGVLVVAHEVRHERER